MLFVACGGIGSIKRIIGSFGATALDLDAINGQYYKHFILVNYDSRLVLTSKLLILMTLELLFTSIGAL